MVAGDRQVIDVMSMPAINLGKGRGAVDATPDQKVLMYQKIVQIVLEARNYQAVVVTPIGCGAFGWKAPVVAHMMITAWRFFKPGARLILAVRLTDYDKYVSQTSGGNLVAFEEVWRATPNVEVVRLEALLDTPILVESDVEEVDSMEHDEEIPPTVDDDDVDYDPSESDKGEDKQEMDVDEANADPPDVIRFLPKRGDVVKQLFDYIRKWEQRPGFTLVGNPSQLTWEFVEATSGTSAPRVQTPCLKLSKQIWQELRRRVAFSDVDEIDLWASVSCLVATEIVVKGLSAINKEGDYTKAYYDQNVNFAEIGNYKVTESTPQFEVQHNKTCTFTAMQHGIYSRERLDYFIEDVNSMEAKRVWSRSEDSLLPYVESDNLFALRCPTQQSVDNIPVTTLSTGRDEIILLRSLRAMLHGLRTQRHFGSP